MKITRLRGWTVSVEKNLPAPGEDPEWVIVFEEKLPPSGDVITFDMNRETRNALVHALTDGAVLAGGELPRL